MRFMTDATNPNKRFDEHVEYLEEVTGKSLPMWTYASEELLELEYREVFLKTWQFAGHVSDVQKSGEYLVFDLWKLVFARNIVQRRINRIHQISCRKNEIPAAGGFGVAGFKIPRR